MKRLAGMLGRALSSTARWWPQVAQGAAWVQGASAILRNDEGLSADALMARYRDWLAQMESAAKRADLPDTLCKALSHFVKVSASYGGDVFHCYRIAGLPRTNNALEQAFGSLRYHERRASGRKVASPSLVLSGSVRMPAALFTRTGTVTRDMLAAVPQDRWRATRTDLERRRQARCQRHRFRKDPAHYLAGLETLCDELNVLTEFSLAMSPSNVGMSPKWPGASFRGTRFSWRPVSSASPGSWADSASRRHERRAASHAAGCDTR